MLSSLVRGPLWSDSVRTHAGRFPLAVESFAMARVGELAPGVTTVTPHAKYYALHAHVARSVVGGPFDGDWQELLRRCEVLVAAASIHHIRQDPSAHDGLSQPHGAEVIERALRGDGQLRLSEVAKPGSYAESKRGFLGPYIGSERGLGLVSDEGGQLQPGSRAETDPMPPSFHGLIDMARRDTVLTQDLEDRHEWCVCGRDAPETAWLRRVFLPKEVMPAGQDDKRSQTMRMLLRLIELYTPATIGRGLEAHLVAQQDLDSDPVLRDLEVVDAWRGVVLRRWFAWGWRDLWAWLVNDHLASAAYVSDFCDGLADHLPSTSLRKFIHGLPDPMAGGRPTAAEFDDELTSWDKGALSFAWIVLGSQRQDRLGEREAVYFTSEDRERRNAELTPAWTKSYLDDRSGQNVRDVSVDLVRRVLRRSQRVAMAKAKVESGRLIVPSRVHVRDDVVVADSREGGGPVSLRWDQMCQVLGGLGLVSKVDDRWQVSEAVSQA